MGVAVRKKAAAFGACVALLANLALFPQAGAQPGERPLRPAPPGGIPVIPFQEGWYGNEDGSVTVSFGYHNRNESVITIPRGENNLLEPARFGGMQPEIFHPGRHHGVFAIIIPAEMADDTTAWWHLISAGQELKVPGERGSTAYELDRNPRPQGSLQPWIGFSEGGAMGSGPEGIVSDEVLQASVNQPITLEVWTDDPSERDPNDPRFRRPLDTRVSWYVHQGPGEATFTAHESMPLLEARQLPAAARLAQPQIANEVIEGEGPARVNASFPEPGEYLIRARLDNWNASDSDGLDQCCWSNAWLRVQAR